MERHLKPFIGTVVAAGVNLKTVKVRVAKQIWNAFLRKNFAGHKNYMAHDENNACISGDVVRITPDGRLSKRKRWVVEQIVTHYGVGERTPLETVEERLLRKGQEREEQIEKKAGKLERRAEREEAARLLKEKWRSARSREKIEQEKKRKSEADGKKAAKARAKEMAMS